MRPLRDDITLSDWAFEGLSGGQYTPEADLYLRGRIVRSRLESAVAIAIASGLLDIPPIDASVLGSIASAATMDTTARVREGAIVVGLDVASGGVVTTGNGISRPGRRASVSRWRTTAGAIR